MSAIHYTKRGSEAPASMPQHYDTHEAWKSKGIGYKTKILFQNAVTTDTYTDNESPVFDMRLFSRAVVHLKELNVNAVTYNILVCIDPSQWETLYTDQALAKNGTAKQTITDPWNWVKVQVKTAVSPNAGKVNAFINGKTP